MSCRIVPGFSSSSFSVLVSHWSLWCIWHWSLLTTGPPASVCTSLFIAAVLTTACGNCLVSRGEDKKRGEDIWWNLLTLKKQMDSDCWGLMDDWWGSCGNDITVFKNKTSIEFFHSYEMLSVISHRDWQGKTSCQDGRTGVRWLCVHVKPLCRKIKKHVLERSHVDSLW